MWPIHKVVVGKWSLCYPYSSPEGLFRVIHKWPPEKFTKSYKLRHATWPQDSNPHPRSNGSDSRGTPAGTDRTRTSPTATNRESTPTKVGLQWVYSHGPQSRDPSECHPHPRMGVTSATRENAQARPTAPTDRRKRPFSFPLFKYHSYFSMKHLVTFALKQFL